MLTRTRLISAAVAAAALAAPAVASADSIVYADQGNIWTMQPDGSGKVKLTDGGSWHSPTQADDGTIAAVQGTGPITVMAKDGRVLRTIATPSAKSGNGGTFAPAPVDLSFSPDGSKIAYSYVNMSCPVASSCGSLQRSTFYTRADVSQATPHTEWGNQFGVSDPEWITNDKTLVFGGYGSQVSIDKLGGGDYSFDPWMTPEADQGDGELSRDGKKLATTFFYGADTILAFFAVYNDLTSDLHPAQPIAACNTSAPDAKFADPSWAPDSSRLAFESSLGVETIHFTKLNYSGCATTGDSKVVAPTGSQPDWGPAEPATARFGTSGPSGGGAAGGGTKPPAATPAPVTTTATPVVKTPADSTTDGKTLGTVTVGGAARQAFRGKLAVVCDAPGAKACSSTATVKVGAKAHRATGAGAPGRQITLRFSAKSAKAIKKALRRGKALKATVVLTAEGADGEAVTARRTIRLAR